MPNETAAKKASAARTKTKRALLSDHARLRTKQILAGAEHLIFRFHFL
jgi:hypothetical protein